MSSSLGNKKRNVIPRWRNTHLTITVGELAQRRKAILNKSNPEQSLIDKKKEWEANKTLAHATDFVSSAFVLDRIDMASEAIEFLDKRRELLSESTKNIIDSVLQGKNNQKFISQTPINRYHNKISFYKNKLKKDPWNTLVWVDLAREYTILGHDEKAKKAIETALTLSPYNRFILRSASRFYIHSGDKEKANDILKNNIRTKKDPWLLAAEFASSSVIDRRSTLYRSFKDIINSKIFNNYELSELFAAAGMQELYFGTKKKARDYFLKSIKVPHENALAQIIWLTNQLVKTDFEVETDKLPSFSFEAFTRQLQVKGKWDEALKNGEMWFFDQPFSSNPSIFLSYITGVAIEDFQKSVRYSKGGLTANPEDYILWNNLAFASANLGNVKEAIIAFSKIDENMLDNREKIVHTATKGLIEYKKGNYFEGKKLYLQSIDLASKFSFPELRAMAAINLAKEELLAISNTAEENYNRALDYSSKRKEPELVALVERLKKLYSEKRNQKN